MSMRNIIARIKPFHYLYSVYSVARSVGKMGGGKSLLFNMLDCIFCNVAYGASPSDYITLQFYKYKHHECAKYETIRRHDKILQIIQKTFETEGCLEDKDVEYIKYSSFIHRNWMVATKDTTLTKIYDFITENELVLAKPVGTGCGYGIVKISKDDMSEVNKIVSRIGGSKYEEKYIFEECIFNSPYLKELNSSSLNTFRVFTATDRTGNSKILEIMLRVGCPGMYVDNWSAGGIMYKVDINTGIVIQPGIDKERNQYIFHPGSNVKMVGFTIPRFEKLKKTIYDYIEADKRVSIVGWDITETNKGFEFIEMNSPGGHDIMQFWGTPYYDIIKEAVYD